jgi:hypothetical protein
MENLLQSSLRTANNRLETTNNFNAKYSFYNGFIAFFIILISLQIFFDWNSNFPSASQKVEKVPFQNPSFLNNDNPVWYSIYLEMDEKDEYASKFYKIYLY